MAEERTGAGLLAGLSNELAAAVEQAAGYTVTVDARRRQPASGIVWSADGVIVTADHVVERDEDIGVRLADGRKLAATVVGRDPSTDLAVLRVEASGLPAAQRGEAAKVGHLALLVGRPNGSPSATIGVVSALAGPIRTWRGGLIEGILRTDATMLPGFSGGPLADTTGRALGVCTSHLAQGAGLAICMDTVDRVAKALLSGGRIRRGYLGITSQPVQLPAPLRSKLELEQNAGLLVVGVVPDGPAEAAGVFIGDILIGLAGEPVRDTEDLQVILTPERVGQAVPMRVLRGGESAALTVTVGERP